ncbi:Uncharacterized protein Adt_23279 [Abeliophyllum distichum]|uniref:Uncharacterized protein n=1 Tax=Abeliophyllum distichum TaxID=126358 RepID=A0ABD1SC31_9LAMI
MASTNTKLGLENKALQSKVEALTSGEAVKMKLEIIVENIQQAKAMVLQKDRLLAEVSTYFERVSEELTAAKDSVVEAEAKVMKAYKKNFQSTPEYARLTALFMETSGD